MFWFKNGMFGTGSAPLLELGCIEKALLWFWESSVSCSVLYRFYGACTYKYINLGMSIILCPLSPIHKKAYRNNGSSYFMSNFIIKSRKCIEINYLGPCYYNRVSSFQISRLRNPCQWFVYYSVISGKKHSHKGCIHLLVMISPVLFLQVPVCWQTNSKQMILNTTRYSTGN